MAKYSNFTPTANVAGTRYATLVETTGLWWWRRSRVREVAREPGSSYWRYVDTGKFTEGFEVEALANAERLQSLRDQAQ